ncbi:MAG: 3-dehydroquinate synthase [bacterium]|nr:3-dehydroquinate synthase [bacterium]
MKSVCVHLGERGYTIRIVSGALSLLGETARVHFAGGRALIVSDTNVAPLFGPKALASLKRAGVAAELFAVPAGERSKSDRQLGRIYDRLARMHIDRGCGIVALGGGVVGDLAGYAAATYLRGLPYIQVPTSLLAQVDSAVGGKTAIDHPAGKNLIGAFYQPAAVLSDTAALKKLPAREFHAGFAEVVKHAAIADRRLFAYLEKNAARLLRREAAPLAHVVAVNCRIKARVVEADERESNLRQILNFGHTLGHAVEAAAGYSRRLLHGEAVAIGMAAAARLSFREGRCTEAEAARLIDLLARFALPVSMRRPPAEAALRRLVARDKKSHRGEAQFVLMEKIGRVRTGCALSGKGWRTALTG